MEQSFRLTVMTWVAGRSRWQEVPSHEIRSLDIRHIWTPLCLNSVLGVERKLHYDCWAAHCRLYLQPSGRSQRPVFRIRG